MNEYHQPVYIAPMAKPSIHDPDDTSFSLMTKVDEFLFSDCQVMLILGESGEGKSTFNRYLEHKLWQEYTSGDRIPLFINLPVLEQPENELIQEQLRIYNFTELQIQDLQRHCQFTLICDGYDESQLKCNLHTTNRLNLLDRRGPKLIIACRTQYFGFDYSYRFAPNFEDHSDHAASNLFQECVIIPFTDSQIEEYVEQYVPLEPRTWSKADYMEKLEIILNLKDLVRNPFLLMLCLETLPSIVKNETDLSWLRLTRVQLYDGFVQHWLRISKQRLLDANARLEGVDNSAFEMLFDDGFKHNGLSFQVDLATAIYLEQDGRPIIDYSHQQKEDTWKTQFFGVDRVKSLLRDSSLLSRNGAHHQFIHRSVLEYFYSCMICGPNTTDDIFSTYIHSSIDNHPLSKRDLVNEPSILQFLSERAFQVISFKQYLLFILQRSKKDEKAARAAANAITILVKAGIRFNGQDFRGICIPGADLSEGEFDSVQLHGANLSRVKFTKTWIRQADFTEAIMDEVHFGEQSFLEFRNSVYSCAYSPNGKTFAAGLSSGEVIFYNTANWTQTCVMRGQLGTVNGLSFSPSGDRLLSGGMDHKVCLWRCATGLVDFDLKGHTDFEGTVAYSPCGKQMATFSHDRTVRLWDAEAGSALFVLSFHKDWIHGIAYSPDGMTISSACSDGMIRIFDTQTGQLKQVLKCGDPVFYIAYSPDGLMIVSGNSSGELQLWNSKSSELLRRWSCHIKTITKVIFSPNGQWIASCGYDKTVKLWSTCTWRLSSSFTGHIDRANSIVFSPDSKLLASGSSDRTVRLWNLSEIEAEPIKRDSSDGVRSIFSADEQFVLSANTSGVVKRYNALSGELEQTTLCGYKGAYLSVLSPNGQQIAIVGQFDRHVDVWNTKSGMSEFVLAGHTEIVGAVAYSPSGHMIATGSLDTTIRLWDKKSGSLIRVLGDHKTGVLSLQFSSNGQQIISSDDEEIILIWEVDTDVCRMFCAEKDANQDLSDVKFSPINLQVAILHYHKHTINIWDPLGTKLQCTLKHDGRVFNLAWSYCEQWIAVGCAKSVWLWNRMSDMSLNWTCAVVIRNFHGFIHSIDWKPNELTLVTGCNDGSVRVWKLVNLLNVWSAQLIWGAGNGVLAAADAIFSKVIGLSPIHQKLLEQRK